MPKIKTADVATFVEHTTALRELLEKIRRYEPRANYYLAMEDLHLMIGDSHDARG